MEARGETETLEAKLLKQRLDLAAARGCAGQGFLLLRSVGHGGGVARYRSATQSRTVRVPEVSRKIISGPERNLR